MNFPLLESKHTLWCNVPMVPTHITRLGQRLHIDRTGAMWQRASGPPCNGMWGLVDEPIICWDNELSEINPFRDLPLFKEHEYGSTFSSNRICSYQRNDTICADFTVR